MQEQAKKELSMKMRRRSMIACTMALAVFFVVLSACSDGTGATSSSSSVQTARTPMSNTQTPGTDTQSVQSGDIPDTQTFVTYTSVPGSYSLEVPEGWARTVNGADVRFINHFDGVEVALTQASTEPTVESVRSQQVLDLEKTGRTVRDAQVQSKQLASRSSILITYTSDSEPDIVTGKQVRLENNRYLFFHNDKLAALTFWAPQGADNVDQWSRMANSFKWV
jgi:hypothetical protein